MNGFIPALRFSMLTPVYDAFMRLLMKDIRLKALLVSLMGLKPGDTVLDFGCGTGTLALMIKQAHPACRVEGIDIDPQILEIARRKARSRHLTVEFTAYDGMTLPYGNESFDIVVSSYVVHHLSHGDKTRLFREISRVLESGGRLFILDFGIPRSWYARAMTSVTRRIEPVGDNILGKVPGYIQDAGFSDVEELTHEGTFFGTVSFWRAER